MTSGGNADNREYRLRLNRERANEGQCTYCPPHRGENGARCKNKHAWVKRLGWINRKDKEKK